MRFIFTLRVPPNSNTDGVTASLNNVTAVIAAQNTGIMFTPVARFGKKIHFKTMLYSTKFVDYKLYHFNCKVSQSLNM